MRISILAATLLFRNGLAVDDLEPSAAQRYRLDFSETLENSANEQGRNYARGEQIAASDYKENETPPEYNPTITGGGPEPTDNPCPPDQRKCGAKWARRDVTENASQVEQNAGMKDCHGECVKAGAKFCPKGMEDCYGECVKAGAKCCPKGMEDCYGECVKVGAKCCPKGMEDCHGECIRIEDKCCKNGPCPKETCQPGLQWAFYQGRRVDTTQPGGVPYNKIPSSSWYTSFDIQTFLQGQTPFIKGTTKIFGLDQGDPSYRNSRTVYGSEVPTREYSVILHIGYFHPKKAGKYTFTPLYVDEAVLAWFGDKAKYGFTNTNMEVHGNWNAPSTPFTYTVQRAGDYIPFRLMWANAQGGNGFSFLVNDPDGVQVVSREKPLIDDQFVFGCGAESRAPPFNF
ncbi:GLEYA motif domain-containing protein [Hirsutella rhossiliensis]|uniref:GLEYA domain-containing protein n=1 Tax=Hirsutella rhossiliensis TaxID=111463 RepID=A0A9P8MWM7_9HYPO|nr:GLEYA domain-containing protein [Hirsutella rhossiliensis]KAH0962392.1 GLEYA domain-containing protein [Hirsutella rhossiliensis]